MSFLGLVWHNLRTRIVRTSLTTASIAIAVSGIVTLGVLTHSLRRTAVTILRTGNADFTIAQKNVSDVLFSSVGESDLKQVAQSQGVEDTVGILVATTKLDETHPVFLEIGIQPEKLDSFGLQVLSGQVFNGAVDGEMMLGYRAARDLNKGVGDTLSIGDSQFKVVAIYSTNQVFADSASMFPLAQLQSRERRPGKLTLGLVRARPNTDIDALRARIETQYPTLATIKSESEFGRVDRNLLLITAADTGVLILALAIGAIVVSNTMTMSVFERTREFGILRAIGWTRARIGALVMFEAVAIVLAGSALGCLLGWAGVHGIEQASELTGIFHPDFTAAVFGRALAVAAAMTAIGVAYPTVLAASLTPLSALRHE